MEMKHMPKGYFYELADLTEVGYQFSWEIKSSVDSNIVAYIYEGDIVGMVDYTVETLEQFNTVHRLETHPSYYNRYVGASMLAYVAKDSLDRGFEGFMVVESKTNLRRYYIDRLGGIQLGNSDRIMFGTKAAQELITRFLEV